MHTLTQKPVDCNENSKWHAPMMSTWLADETSLSLTNRGCVKVTKSFSSWVFVFTPQHVMEKAESRSEFHSLLCDLCTSLSPLGGPAPPGHLHAVPDGLYRVKSGAYVQDGELVRVFVDFTVVVIDDVAHLLPTAVDDPVVAVEGKLIAEEQEKREVSVLNLCGSSRQKYARAQSSTMITNMTKLRHKKGLHQSSRTLKHDLF